MTDDETTRFERLLRDHVQEEERRFGELVAQGEARAKRTQANAEAIIEIKQSMLSLRAASASTATATHAAITRLDRLESLLGQIAADAQSSSVFAKSTHDAIPPMRERLASLTDHQANADSVIDSLRADFAKHDSDLKALKIAQARGEAAEAAVAAAEELARKRAGAKIGAAQFVFALLVTIINLAVWLATRHHP